MKLLIEIGYVMLALLLLALIFVSFDYSFIESVFLGTLFLPGAFFLKFFIPQLALSHGKKKIADTFFLSMSVILFTFLLMVVSHLYIIPVSKFKQIWVNPIFTALILGLIAGGDMLMQRFRSRISQKIPETISFVSDRRKVSLNVDDIVYVESNDRDVYGEHFGRKVHTHPQGLSREHGLHRRDRGRVGLRQRREDTGIEEIQG